MNAVVIREAKIEDLQSLWTFLEALSDDEKAFFERVPQKILADDHHVAVALLDVEVLGYAWVQDYGSHLRAGHKTARFHDLIVAECMRRLYQSRGFSALEKYVDDDGNECVPMELVLN